MAKILFDCALLSTPYRLKRCTYQLMHLALIARRMGHDVRILTSEQHLKQHLFLSEHCGDILTDSRDNKWPDIYVAKSDAFYRDENCAVIDNCKAYKVCLCNSDHCFRETSQPFRGHLGTPVQIRCDLYMPANHSAGLLITKPCWFKPWSLSSVSTRIIPTAHPIAPGMCELFMSMGLYEAYLDDDFKKIRLAFRQGETRKCGFMGSGMPKRTRKEMSKLFPKWVDFNWRRGAKPKAYIKWMMRRRGCLDLRGYGDKSLRFTEAALLGRTIVTSDRASQYDPGLLHGVNCILHDRECHLEYDHDLWLNASYKATEDYISGWSMRAQMCSIISMAGA